MRIVAIATLAALWPLAAHAQSGKREVEWCPDLASMFTHLSSGFELKAVTKRVYTTHDNSPTMPSDVSSETVFFLQKGPQMEQCVEQVKFDRSTVATCSYLVERFDTSNGSPCSS